MLALAILGLLQVEPLHGYEIRKQLAELLGISGAISYGSLYPTLAKLNRQGYIEATTGQPFVPTKKKVETFSTGSLSGDLAANSKASFFRSAPLLNRKNKKIYSITETGQAAFDELLSSSIAKHAEDDRLFVVHLAFIDRAKKDDQNQFVTKRISALNNRLDQMPQPTNTPLGVWHEVERRFVKEQIEFLESLSKTKIS